jgi:hypothetical protein
MSEELNKINNDENIVYHLNAEKHLDPSVEESLLVMIKQIKKDFYDFKSNTFCHACKFQGPYLTVPCEDHRVKQDAGERGGK